MSDRYVPDNFNDAARSYVVGILSPSTTLYIDRPDSNNRRSASPPDELALRRRNTNSFQITSVTVQGSRSKADDLGDGDSDMEDHTDDLSSDFLDSSRCDNDCYNSPEDCTINSICEDLSPPGNCSGPIVFPNVNLGVNHQGVTPTFASVGPVASGGVTMMTSKSESPVSAQVPVMNPLPENWQRRFRVVKIVSSEPFRRGRWTCMDFKDPPTVHPEIRPELGRLNSHPPTIQVTNYDAEIMLPSGHEPHLCGLPIEQTYNGNFVMSNQQQMYGIILPQNDQVPPVALVQDMSIQTTVDRNSNHIMDQQSAMYQQNSLVNSMPYSPSSTMRQPVTVVSSGFVPNKTYSQSANSAGSNQHAVNCPALSSVNINSSTRHRTNSGSNIDKMNARNKMDTDNTESFSSLASELSRTSGFSRPTPLRAVPANVANVVANCPCSPPPRLPVNVVRRAAAPVLPPSAVVVAKAVVMIDSTPPVGVECNNSSQTAPEKIPSSAEVGHDVEPPAGSAASAGSNTVAIDNKIEQAMDLVKSHLMFAVREEVEVLKEKISELLERISQLEHENDILRANASAETLKQLNNQSHKKILSGQSVKPQPAPPQPSTT